MSSGPAVKGTLWSRIELELKLFIFPRLLRSSLFLIKHVLLHSFPCTHTSTPAWKLPPVEGNYGNVCLRSNCTVLIPVHNVLFSK